MAHASQKFALGFSSALKLAAQSGYFFVRQLSLMRVLHEGECLLEAFPNAFDDQKLAVSRHGNCAKVQLVVPRAHLGPEVRGKRGVLPRISPELFGIRQENFEKWEGLSERAGREPIRGSSRPNQRSIAVSLKHCVAQRGEQIE